MKFCKHLHYTIEKCDVEWCMHWINYKSLKKKLKEMPCNKARSSSTHSNSNEQAQTSASSSSSSAVSITTTTTTTPAAAATSTTDIKSQMEQLSQSRDETEFFRMVQLELKKTREFYASTLAQDVIRLARLRESMTLLESDNQLLARQEGTWVSLMRACVNLYKDALKLETYCIVSWTGFSKIVKKHDKRTGFCCRQKFLLNVLSKQPFTHYPQLSRMLEELEEMYVHIQELRQGMQGEGAGGNQSLQDEVLFLEAMRGINREVSRVQRATAAEHAVEARSPCCNKRPRLEGKEDTATGKDKDKEEGDKR